MENSTQQFHAILFADVAGSTRLYEKLGDRAAREAIGSLLGSMTEVANRHGGVLVKTIGDEILCRFPTAERGVRAAITMQEELTADTTRPVRLQMRMGLQWGPVILEHGDVFGDAVNVAARMSAIARAGQIITTRETIIALPEALAQKARLIDTTQVKGKQDSLVIYEVVWEEENVTRFVASTDPGLTVGGTPATLSIRYQDQEQTLALGGSLGIGRAETCELVVESPLASRHHARIESRRGKFVFVDQSTNGSYVRSEDGKISYLRREELPLWGSGSISLGEEPKDNDIHLLRFAVQANIAALKGE